MLLVLTQTLETISAVFTRLPRSRESILWKVRAGYFAVLSIVLPVASKQPCSVPVLPATQSKGLQVLILWKLTKNPKILE